MKKFLLIVLVGLLWTQFGCSLQNMRSRTVDDFSGEISISEGVQIRTNFDAKGAVNFRVHKMIHNEKVTYMISLHGASPDIYYGNGLYLMLENNMKLEFPGAEIDFDYEPGGVYNGVYIPGSYVWSIYEFITKDQMKLLCRYGITKWKVYIFDGKVSNPKKTSKLCLDILKAK